MFSDFGDSYHIYRACELVFFIWMSLCISSCICILVHVFLYFLLSVSLPPPPTARTPAGWDGGYQLDLRDTQLVPFFENQLNSSICLEPIQLVSFLRTHSTRSFFENQLNLSLLLRTHSTRSFFFENPFNSSLFGEPIQLVQFVWEPIQLLPFLRTPFSQNKFNLSFFCRTCWIFPFLKTIQGFF